MYKENGKERRTLYTMLIIVGIAVICFMGLLLISENSSAAKILLVDDDGIVGKPSQNSGNGRGFVQAMLDYGLVDGQDFTIIDCGGYTGNPDFSGIDLDDYDILIWQGYYAWDYNSYGGQFMAQTMINDFFKEGKMVWWSDSYYSGYYYYNHNNLKDQWFKASLTYDFNTQYCYFYNQPFNVYGIDNDVLPDITDVTDSSNKLTGRGNTPNTYGYGHYHVGADTSKGSADFLKMEAPNNNYYNRNAGIAYEDDTYGYKAIMTANFVNNLNRNDRADLFEFIIDWYAPMDKEGDGEMTEPEDNADIKGGISGLDDVTFKWKYKDPNGAEENPMKYYLYLSRQMSDINDMATEYPEMRMKYIPDEGGILNSDYDLTDPTTFNGYIATIPDPYNDVDGDGYSHIEWKYKDHMPTGLGDGIWYWGVLAEEIKSPTIQRFRTPLTGSGNYRSFNIDTTAPNIVFSSCEPVLPADGEGTRRHLDITSENAELVPTNENPFTIVVNETKTEGYCSGIDVSKTMSSFDFTIYISGHEVPMLDKEAWEYRCHPVEPKAIPNEEAPYKVTFKWTLKDEYKNILKGTVYFYFNFTVYDNFGNANPETGSWTIDFNIDVEKPKAPLTPSVEFYKGEGGKTEYVWLGDMTYRISTTGPSRYSVDPYWDDNTMDTAECGVEFGRIRDGRTSADWEGGDSIGFMSTPAAYSDGEGPATYYWIDFIPDVDDIAYVARSVDWADNTNESEQLTGDDGKQFEVDKEGPVAPTWDIEITGEDINDDGTIKVKGIVKEDMPKKKGCGIRSVTVYAEGKDKNDEWSVEEDHSVTAFLYDVIDEDAGDYTELLEGRFTVSKLPLWAGVNRIYAIANDLLGNPIQYDDYGGWQHMRDERDGQPPYIDTRDFEMALWDYGKANPDIVSDPQYIMKVNSAIKGQDIEITNVNDFMIRFTKLPAGNHWIDVERRDNPTELAKWPKSATVGTLNQVYWHVDTSITGGFQAVIQIYYYDEAGGPAKGVNNDDLRVIANSDKEDNWELVSSEPPTKYGNKYKCVFTVDHFTDFAIIELNPRPYALIDKVTMDHDTILSGETLRISAKLANEGTFTKDSGSKDNPIEVSFDAKNIKTGEVIHLGTRELAGGVLKAGETDAYVNITWVIPKKGEYIITAQLDPNGTAAPSAPGYSVEDTGRFEALEVEEVTTSFASSLWTVALAVSLVAVFSAVKRRRR